MRLWLCRIVIAGSKLGDCCASKSITNAGSRFAVSITRFTTSSVTGSVLSNRRLSRFSIDHAISLMLKAPTIRPEPFKVWNPLRTSVSGVKSFESCCQIGKKSSKSAMTSVTSSIKMSRISASISKLSGLTCSRARVNGSLSVLSSSAVSCPTTRSLSTSVKAWLATSF